MSKATQQKQLARRMGKIWTAWEPVEITDEMRAQHKYLTNVHSVFRNSRYVVHMFSITTDLGGVMQVDVMPFVRDREIPYEDMQRLKGDLFSPDAVALEVYPAASIDMHTEANVRVMWVMPTDFNLAFGLHLPTAFGGHE